MRLSCISRRSVQTARRPDDQGLSMPNCNVRCGSEGDIDPLRDQVRFAPDNGLRTSPDRWTITGAHTGPAAARCSFSARDAAENGSLANGGGVVSRSYR
jgi:hypothetical protein